MPSLPYVPVLAQLASAGSQVVTGVFLAMFYVPVLAQFASAGGFDMRVPLSWLHEYCAPPLTAAALASRLATTGTEVERVEHHGVGAPERFVVGRVVRVEGHPRADRLSVTTVDTGGDVQAQIVCGAPNVAAGQTVAVAKPGAVLPDGTRLETVKLRGIESQGMILAEDELGIGTEHAGILVFEDSYLSPGAPLADVLPIATDVLVLEITPNRPDCLGIYGVAREVHAATGAALGAPPWAEDPGTTDTAPDGITIDVQCPELCPRFTARVFEDVEVGPSPPWLKARLMAAGQRPINNVVDITNYAMLLTGQPLHAFDLDRIAGAKLTVRTAHANETIQTLDGQTRTLDGDVVLIADGDGPTSIAGLMGGERSEVHGNTTRVLMEVANWIGPNIHRTSLKLGLRSEASARFEKQLQPEQALEAQVVATKLMMELCGATLAPGTLDIGGPGPPPITIRLRDARVTGLLGTEIARERSKAILESLEFEATDAGDGLDVKPPPFRRADVTREADLIEEVARIDGVDKLPATLPSRHGARGRLTPRQRLRRSAADALTAQGLHEIVGWSFTGRDQERRLRLDGRPAVQLENPLSSDQSQLRTTLLGSLLDVAQRNRAHGAGSIRVFEAGAVYLPGDGPLPREPHHVGALLAGAVRPPTWREAESPRADFFTAKGVLHGMLETLRAPWSVERATDTPFLHPGRAATILIADQPAGWLGEIHPLIAAEWDLDDVVAVFEVDLDAVAKLVPEATLYEDVTSYPAVREDLAVIVPQDTTAARVLAAARAAAGELLRDVRVFDVYTGPQVGEGNRSLALALSFRASDRTLSEEDVAPVRARIIAALGELGGELRNG